MELMCNIIMDQWWTDYWSVNRTAVLYGPEKWIDGTIWGYYGRCAEWHANKRSLPTPCVIFSARHSMCSMFLLHLSSLSWYLSLTSFYFPPPHTFTPLQPFLCGLHCQTHPLHIPDPSPLLHTSASTSSRLCFHLSYRSVNHNCYTRCAY